MAQKLPPADVLSRLYTQKRLSLQQIGERYGVTREAVRQSLEKAGVPRNISRARVLDEQVLRELYVERHLKLIEIARELGTTADKVRREIHRYKMTRPPKLRYLAQKYSREIIEDLYVRQRKNQLEISKQLGLDIDTFRKLLRHHRIGFRLRTNVDRRLSDVVTDPELRRLYVKEGLDLKQIGKQLGFSSHAIGNRLHRLGVPRRRESTKLVLDEKQLRRMYIDEGLSPNQIGRIFGVTHVPVRRLLRIYGIPIVRMRGRLQD